MGWDAASSWGKQITTQDGVTVSANKAVKSTAIKKILKNNEIHYIKAKALTDVAAKPKKGEQYRIITEKQFNAYALILLILQDEVIEEMFLAIYRINQPTVDSLIDFIDAGKIKKATFVISNFFNQTKKPEVWAKKLRDYCETNKSCKHVYIHNHSKILAVKTNKGDHYVFEGSGNMSDNARIEQYLYENCEQSFSFHKDWMQRLITAK